MSLQSCITLRTVKGSVLSWAELDNNFIWLNGRDIVDATIDGGNNLVLIKEDKSYYSLPLSGVGTTVSNLSFSGNVLTLTQSNGDTVSVNISSVDIRVTDLVYSGETLTLYQSDGTNETVLIPKFSGNTSGDCITDIYVSNVNSCSPLHIQPNSNGDVLIGENGGVNVGIGTTTPNAKLGIKGIGSTLSTYGIKIQNSGGTDNFVVRDDGATITNNSMFFNKLNQFQSLVAGDTIGTFNDNISIAAGIQTPSTNRFRLSYYEYFDST